ncbi:MAG: hypothetical protein DLM71_03100 [Chloroflexi bacterium]|nr:MAG: hypothetical protein DLM71_03100 [Chloroflexota bacterium]
MDVDDQLLGEFTRRIGGPGEQTWKDQEAFLANPVIRALAFGLGVDLSALDNLHHDVRESAIASIQAAIWFSEFGWTVSARAPTARRTPRRSGSGRRPPTRRSLTSA